LEFGTKNLVNIGGATAIKHMIFYHSDGYWKHLSAYSDKDTAWEAIHGEFMRLFELAEGQNWEQMDTEDLFNRGSRTKLKSLYLYYPDHIIPIVAPLHMKHFLMLLGDDEADLKGLSSILLNRRLQQKLRVFPEAQRFSTRELMRCLYEWNDPREDDTITTYSQKRQDDVPPDEQKPSSLFLSIADALERKGQVILHGPPGTGKTYHALRFAEWWLARSNGRTLDDLTARQTPRRVWWVVANPKQWRWDTLFTDGHVEYKYGRLKRNYPLVQPGDLVVGYHSQPDMQIVALARVRAGLQDGDGDPYITLEPVHRIDNGLTYAELTADATLSQSEPMYNRCQGTLFRLEEREADYLLSLLSERDPKIKDYIDQSETHTDVQNQLTLVTFHPSYSYEDFIEGFRPQDSGDGLRLRLSDGLFKTICNSALANPSRKYLILIDEINRANLAKVFGEIITLLERDKRGVRVVLPQSKEPFSVPENVFMLATMNTSDRSIRLMDAALRRRFSFIEVMPELSLLRGAQIDGVLDLYEFLTVLNTRISRTQGRDKQIGHSFFLEDAQPISDGSEFAQRFRQEVLPLLQEYCYDDYGELAEYIGADLVDVENALFHSNILYDDERLVAALAEFISTISRSE
jgi:5-methylcytosine-specific restriction protein B